MINDQRVMSIVCVFISGDDVEENMNTRETSTFSDCSLLINHCSMYQHNLLLIYMNFKRFKTTFCINLIGLSTGLTCTLLIYLWVDDELHIGKYFENDSRIFQVMQNTSGTNGIETIE